MRFWRSIGLLMLALSIFAVPAHAAKEPAKQSKAGGGSMPQRRAWMFGITPGYGGTRFVGTWRTIVGEFRSDSPAEYPTLVTGHPNWIGTGIESGRTLQYRVGYAVNPQLTIGFERAQWFKDFVSYSWRFNTSLMSATYYPGAGHLFVRGGAGISAMAEKIPGTAPFFTQYADQGFGLEGAVGGEWRILKRVSIAPEVAIRALSFGQQMRAQMGTAAVGFNWWF